MSRVLIIEDDGGLQELLSLALFNEGYELHYAFNGKEGYEKILSLHPDLIMLDLMLPILNGIEILKRVSATAALREIPIIVMTGHAEDSDKVEHNVKLQGAREYIRKPFDIHEMVRLIARLILKSPGQIPFSQTQIAKGVVRMDIQFRTVWVNDKLVATLSPNKAQVMTLLIKAGSSVKREKILEVVWGSSERTSALEKTIQRLREDLGAEGQRIQTTHEGYELIG